MKVVLSEKGHHVAMYRVDDPSLLPGVGDKVMVDLLAYEVTGRLWDLKNTGIILEVE